MFSFRKTYDNFFKEVFERYSQMIFSYILEKVGDRVDALDIAQEVFVHLWKYRKSIKQDGKDRGLIIKACRQEIYKFYKSGYQQMRTQTISLENTESTLIDCSVEELEYKIEKEERLEQLYAALELIPARRKEIFLKNKLEGKTRKEIAVEMKMSGSAIGNQIDKAMQFLIGKLRR
ncbi:RNA polymerase sigma factor [Chryseobacterium wanjuense]|nr:sigma-70 family RNA polymerase sigma factor [Chryseobacterium wanjuense]